jgi:hypothetical protein
MGGEGAIKGEGRRCWDSSHLRVVKTDQANVGSNDKTNSKPFSSDLLSENGEMPGIVVLELGVERLNA